MYSPQQMMRPVDSNVLQTAFLSAKNIGTVYGEIHGTFDSEGYTIGTEFVDLVSDIMQQVWKVTRPKQLQQEKGSPKAAILFLNEVTVRHAVKAIRARRKVAPDTPTRHPSRLQTAAQTPSMTHPMAPPAALRPVTRLGVADPGESQIGEPQIRDPHPPLPPPLITGPTIDDGWLGRCTSVSAVREARRHPSPRRREDPPRPTPRNFLIRSADRDTVTWPNAHHYRAPLHDLPSFTKLSLVRLEFAPLHFTVTENNNKLYFSEDDDGMLVVSVPPGSWDISGLLHEIERLMSAAGKYRYRVGKNPITQRVLVEQVTPVVDSQLHLLFEQTRCNLGKILGFNHTDQRGLRRYEAPTPFSLHPCDTLVFSCEELGGRDVPIFLSNADVTELDETLYAGAALTVKWLTLTFRDADGNPFPFEGRDYVVHFRAELSQVSHQTPTNEVHVLAEESRGIEHDPFHASDDFDLDY